MPLTWYLIDQQEVPTGPGPNLKGVLRTERTNVPGGWLVRTVLMHREITQPPGGTPDIETNMAVGLTFVPDASNAWRL